VLSALLFGSAWLRPPACAGGGGLRRPPPPASRGGRGASRRCRVFLGVLPLPFFGLRVAVAVLRVFRPFFLSFACCPRKICYNTFVVLVFLSCFFLFLRPRLLFLPRRPVPLPPLPVLLGLLSCPFARRPVRFPVGLLSPGFPPPLFPPLFPPALVLFLVFRLWLVALLGVGFAFLFLLPCRGGVVLLALCRVLSFRLPRRRRRLSSRRRLSFRLLFPLLLPAPLLLGLLGRVLLPRRLLLPPLLRLVFPSPLVLPLVVRPVRTRFSVLFSRLPSFFLFLVVLVVLSRLVLFLLCVLSSSPVVSSLFRLLLAPLVLSPRLFPLAVFVVWGPARGLAWRLLWVWVFPVLFGCLPVCFRRLGGVLLRVVVVGLLRCRPSLFLCFSFLGGSPPRTMVIARAIA